MPPKPRPARPAPPTAQTPNLRLRLSILAVVCFVALVGAGTYLLTSRHHQKALVASAPKVSQVSVATISASPRIVFRNTALGSKYGFVSMVALNDPAGPRAITDTSCDRVYATEKNYSCLSSQIGVVTTYSAHVLDANLQSTQTLQLTGIPSRTRLSPDGTLVATTSFISGDSYAGTSFSTRTVVTRVGGASLGSLEDFTLIHDGAAIKPVDRNYWGVTFASDDNTFYATVQWSGKTWLVRGNLASRTVTTLHQDAECPSLSPDGTKLVFKQRGNLSTGKWRLVSYDIATGVVTPLAETRSVDDQAEWLDNTHVLYGLPRTGGQAAIDDVWSVNADGTGTPKLLIPQAWSPAVIR
ncbi:WD40-like Beta Propeller Repeat [Frankineae bacterium MT45]|nr:WD40-like Beta Propeller Repeat [Frankineae bacterium MT45]